MDSIPNIKDIIESKDLELYKKQHIDVKPFQYAQMIKKAWKICLYEYILPYDNELK